MSRRKRRLAVADAVAATIAAQILDTLTVLSEDQAHAAARNAARALQDEGWCMHAPATADCAIGRPCPCERPTVPPTAQETHTAPSGSPAPAGRPR